MSSQEAFTLATEVLDGISIVVGVCVIVAVILLRIYRPSLGGTTTVKLSGWIALADIMVSTIQIIYANGNRLLIHSSTLSLGFLLTSLQTSSLFFVYLTVCVALHLHLTLLLPDLKYIALAIEPWLVPVSFLWAFITTIPFHFLFTATWNPAIGGFTKSPQWAAIYYMWGSQYVWLVLSELYCFVVIGMVLRRLWGIKRQQKEKLSSLQQQGTGSSDAAISDRRITFVMLRIVWYPVIPIITQTWLIVMNHVPAPYNLPYVNINNVMSAIQGILNGLVFCINPAIYSAYKEWRHPPQPQESFNTTNTLTTNPIRSHDTRSERSTWIKLQDQGNGSVIAEVDDIAKDHPKWQYAYYQDPIHEDDNPRSKTGSSYHYI
ncbi:hypothetical protein BZG36_01216 [Bifiguratus adelaidae]|uniref:G-protein coupled receptors family 1 profile domain-containing protein n=1 Tax=Bifiguratus adelaidae TaxID=1938954 RepID=A0A261Y5S8_9FUNG|nr:hypothetical protein BZG36_01216 [Bifiguratus adelaidae]